MEIPNASPSHAESSKGNNKSLEYRSVRTKALALDQVSSMAEGTLKSRAASTDTGAAARAQNTFSLRLCASPH
jgi:hypothetical protein